LFLCAATAAVVFSYSVLTADPFGLPKFVYGGVLAALAFAAAAYGAATGSRPFAVCGPDGAVAAMLAAGALSAFFSVDPPLSWLGHYEFYAYGFAACVVYALLYASAAQLRSPRERRWVTRTLALAGAAAGVVAGLQAVGVEPFPGVPTAAAFGGRAISVFGNPVYAGAVFALLLPISLYEAQNSNRARPLFLLALVAVIAGAALTKSRGAWGAAAAGTAFYLWASGFLEARGLTRRRAAAVLAVAVLLLCVAGALVISGKRDSDRGRVALWRSCPQIWASRPIVGVGPAAFGNEFRRVRSLEFIRTLGSGASQANAHNDFLEVLCTTGLVGGIAYLWLLIACWNCLRSALDGPERRAEAASIESEKRPVRRGVSAAVVGALLLAAGALFSAVALRWSKADRAALRARVYQNVRQTQWAFDHYRAAISANPFETEYRMKYLRFLFDRVGKETDAGRKREWSTEAVSVARASVRLRPAHVDSHQMLGLALMKMGDLGDAGLYPQAAEALDDALERAPRFPMLLKMRGAAAEKIGDGPTADAMRRRLAEIGQGPPS